MKLKSGGNIAYFNDRSPLPPKVPDYIKAKIISKLLILLTNHLDVDPLACPRVRAHNLLSILHMYVSSGC
jgi:hypothetical protein